MYVAVNACDVCCLLQDLIRVCQDQIEALLFASIAESQSQDKQNASALDLKPASSSTHAKQPNTPTDVRDVTLVDMKK